MKGHPASFPGIPRRHGARWCIVTAGCAALLAGGCSARKKPTILWATAIRVRPVAPARPATSSKTVAEAGPELRFEFPPEPLRLGPLRGPARPRVAAPPAQNNEVAAKPEQPLMAPQMPPAEARALQGQMNQSVGVAERNLAAANGKTLNDMQTDLFSKVQSFLADAQEAARSGDLRRANSLAKKAQVLSEELAGSL